MPPCFALSARLPSLRHQPCNTMRHRECPTVLTLVAFPLDVIFYAESMPYMPSSFPRFDLGLGFVQGRRPTRIQAFVSKAIVEDSRRALSAGVLAQCFIRGLRFSAVPGNAVFGTLRYFVPDRLGALIHTS